MIAEMMKSGTIPFKDVNFNCKDKMRHANIDNAPFIIFSASKNGAIKLFSRLMGRNETAIPKRTEIKIGELK